MRNLLSRYLDFGFLGVLFLALLVLPIAGCSFASFVSAAEADIPVVETMIGNVATFVAPGVSPALAVAGTATMAVLVVLCGSPAAGASKCAASSLVGQYQAATGSAQTTLLEKIQAVLSAANSQVGNMLAIAKGLPASVGASIATALGVALATVTSLLQLVGTGALANATAAAKLKNFPHPKDLKRQFNAAIAARYPAAALR